MQENLEPQSHLCPRGRATRMVATSSKVSTSIPKPIDIAVTMLLLVYLLFIGMSLPLNLFLNRNQTNLLTRPTHSQVAGEVAGCSIDEGPP